MEGPPPAEPEFFDRASGALLDPGTRLRNGPAIRRFNPDEDIRADYRAQWQEAPSAPRYTSPYRVGWENFLRHLVTGAPLVNDFAAGIRDVQLAEACYRSVAEQKWIALDDLGG